MTDISNVHDTLYIIACKTKGLFQHILHDIAAQIANVCKMIYSRTTGVHFYLSVLVWNELLHFSRQGVK